MKLGRLFLNIILHLFSWNAKLCYSPTMITLSTRSIPVFDPLSGGFGLCALRRGKRLLAGIKHKPFFIVHIQPVALPSPFHLKEVIDYLNNPHEELVLIMRVPAGLQLWGCVLSASQQASMLA